MVGQFVNEMSRPGRPIKQRGEDHETDKPAFHEKVEINSLCDALTAKRPES